MLEGEGEEMHAVKGLRAGKRREQMGDCLLVKGKRGSLFLKTLKAYNRKSL